MNLQTPLKARPSQPQAAYYRQTMQQGSVSFTLAARLFDAPLQEAVQRLYAWCRYCDDQIDEAPNQAEAGRRLEALRRQTEAALAGEVCAQPAFAGLQELIARYRLPAHYLFELLCGFEMDVFHRRYASLAELELYCHRVAGVVGLMMCHLMGLSDVRALAWADAAGRALQLTNIARDVKEDLALGRLYLPLDGFAEAGLRPPDSVAELDAERVYPLVLRLLDAAEDKYRQAYQGLPHLAWRPALATSAALSVYRGIGQRIRRLGPAALEQRTVLSGSSKLRLAASGCLRIFAQTPVRWQRPWQAQPIEEVRYFEC